MDRLLEGFARLYALAVWHDLDETTYVEFPDLNNAGVNDPHVDMYDFPETLRCDGMDCPAGVGNETDWASALRELVDDAVSPQPMLATVLQMLYALYDFNWVVSGQNTDFADRLDELLDPAQQDYFDTAGEPDPGDLYDKWTNIAGNYLLDD
ncbi:hypothetical protein [Paraliomyxa miuraensis]|uniref:hypothetical protein n=1 Tax=Paraliomyxa miuraensis TaxID=376150 RepID=UPI002259436C|nr:hypothetical protein [Paraliomyxa miuraensis]MCX4246704.1 hypothetical protein [Paraliomyxa miuraensis]